MVLVLWVCVRGWYFQDVPAPILGLIDGDMGLLHDLGLSHVVTETVIRRLVSYATFGNCIPSLSRLVMLHV